MKNLLFVFSFLFSIGVHGIALYFTHGPVSQLNRSFRVSIAPSIPKKESSESFAKKGISSAQENEKSNKEISSSEDSKGITEAYLSQLVKIIESNKYYPAISQQLGEVGEVAIRFTVDSSGKLLGVNIESASSFDRLNQAAIKAVQDAGLFPRFPSALGQDKLDLALSLKFISE